MSWNLFHAVAIGTSHIERQLPCQDAAHVWTSGDVLVAAVADGAGSASRSELGSQLCVTAVVEALKACFEDSVERGSDGDVIEQSQARLLDILHDARERMCELASSHQLPARELACTLVGVVALRFGKGYFFHVGDGAGIVQFSDTTLPAVVSQPENGEYSNETWFLTDEGWRNHVRITPFEGPVETLALMSDGSMPFALSKDRMSLYPEFIQPVARYLEDRATEEGNKALQSLLESERTHAITNDDKSLVLAFPST